MDISVLYSSGVLSKGEEIIEHFNGKYKSTKKDIAGLIVFTNKRLIFCRKPSGWFAKGIDVPYYCSWGDIASVSISGWWPKYLNISVKKNDHILRSSFACENIETRKNHIIDIKNTFSEKEIIEAKRIIIEEADKDKPDLILQKRLARGEITLDEFHQKIQRT